MLLIAIEGKHWLLPKQVVMGVQECASTGENRPLEHLLVLGAQEWTMTSRGRHRKKKACRRMSEAPGKQSMECCMGEA